MIDEGTLRERFPEIPWDQPQEVSVLKPNVVEDEHGVERFIEGAGVASFWVCRYCVCMDDGLRSLMRGIVPFGFFVRQEALDHIEREHHD